MFRQQFPDLAHLKSQLNDRWKTGKGWPTIIMNARATESWRPDIRGTLSLFLNLQGESRCGTGSRLTNISPEHFFLTNRHEHYTLAIEAPATVETFNIHFGEEFMEEVLEGLTTPADLLLADSYRTCNQPVHFFSKLYPRTAQFNRHIQALRTHQQSGQTNTLLLEEQLYNLLVYLLTEHRNVLQQIRKLPQVKSTTRHELYKRLSYSVDYIHTHYCRPLELDELAAEASLSKYHFLRVFKLAFRSSPYQLVQQLRVKKAQQLLAGTTLPVSEISVELGYENLSSFSRLFHQRTRHWPQKYRQHAT